MFASKLDMLYKCLKVVSATKVQSFTHQAASTFQDLSQGNKVEGRMFRANNTNVECYERPSVPPFSFILIIFASFDPAHTHFYQTNTF